MLTVVPRHWKSSLSAFSDLLNFRSVMDLARSRERAARRRADEVLDGMPAELLDDIGFLYSADGCLTDQGLVEAAGRLRKGWP